MIISQTPIRVSFFGGGTDFKDYYEKYSGAVISTTIDKYIYIIVNSRCDNDIVINYFDRERVQNVSEIKHDIFREALRITQITKGIEITCITDIPSGGSGLGSSSSLTVGLLNALYAYQGEVKNPYDLAEIACHIEIDILGAPIGKQDQYAAAFGGFKEYRFNVDGTIDTRKVNIGDKNYHELDMCTLLFYTGITRKASSVLDDQKAKIGNNTGTLNTLKEIVSLGKKHLVDLNLKEIGRLLNSNWENKKMLSNKIYNDEINNIYNIGQQAGAYGGKLLGAGGGGFFLFICPPENQKALRKALQYYNELLFTFERYGSRIILSVKDSTFAA
jgi:D-glycero-alpha-D-manno-heptose-7-phosphate kinase